MPPRATDAYHTCKQARSIASPLHLMTFYAEPRSLCHCTRLPATARRTDTLRIFHRKKVLQQRPQQHPGPPWRRHPFLQRPLLLPRLHHIPDSHPAKLLAMLHRAVLHVLRSTFDSSECRLLGYSRSVPAINEMSPKGKASSLLVPARRIHVPATLLEVPRQNYPHNPLLEDFPCRFKVSRLLLLIFAMPLQRPSSPSHPRRVENLPRVGSRLYTEARLGTLRRMPRIPGSEPSAYNLIIPVVRTGPRGPNL
jgi:hypothetical protein